MERREILKAAGGLAMAALAANAAAAGKAEHVHHDHHHHGVDRGANLQALMAAAGDCAQKGELCLAHCLVLLGDGDKAMAACARSVNQTIAVCRLLETLAGQGASHAARFAGLAVDVCQECEDECRKHEKKHAECKACAEACAACIKQCKALAA